MLPNKIDFNAPYILTTNLECKFGTGNTIQLLIAGKKIASDDKTALSALACFDGPIPLVDVVERMQQMGAERAPWIRRLMKWVALGILKTPDDMQLTSTHIVGLAYDSLGGITSCLNDRSRTLAALEGIARTVRPGDNVVDIGTGSGILAFAALRAGASHVYAIEPSPAASLAKKLADENGMADRLTLLHGLSQDIELPVACDVMMSELVSQDPFSENMLGVTADARSRFLKPNARIIPARLNVYARLVAFPETLKGYHWPTAESIDAWQEDYGFSFQAIADFAERERSSKMRQQSGRGDLVNPVRAADMAILSEAVLVASIDLANDTFDPEGEQRWTANIEALRSAEDAALLTYYELDYGGGSTYCNGPSRNLGPTMRRPRLFTDKKLLPLTSGQSIRVEFIRQGAGSKLQVAE